MTVVAFAEKNKAAEEIAKILSSGSYSRTNIEGASAYKFKRNGEDWIITGLAGHIMGYDYPTEYNRWNEVDPGILLDVDPQKFVTKENLANAVEKLSKNAHLIILACDYDREGENIGFEAKELAERVSTAPIKRARYSSFSKSEIEKAFDHPGEPDTNLAMAAETRQILDLKMGAAFTRYVTLSVREKAYTKEVLSIGPCQTPTCGFVYEREKSIREFKPKDFWKILADFDTKEGEKLTAEKEKSEKGNENPNDDAGGKTKAKRTKKNESETEFQGTHRTGQITEKEKADDIFKRIKGEKKAVVDKKTVKEQSLAPPVPLNTTEFLKRASSFLNISPEKALEIAEQLYLSGLTSYPRTETNMYAPDFEFLPILSELTKNPSYSKTIEQLIRETAGKVVPKNGTKDAKDHPPIYPIRGATQPDVEKLVNLPGAYPVYDLICRHFIANLMPSAIFEKTKLDIKIKEEIFDVTGSMKKSSGWLSIYDYETKKDKMLPPMEEGDILFVQKIQNMASKTAPPKKLMESELLTLMDKNGIGTKATAPTHIETNKKRGYFETAGKTISILDTGYMLMESLDTAVPIVIRPEIRSQVENLIQQVEDGKMTMNEALLSGTALIKKMYGDLTANKDRLVQKLAGSIKSEAAESDKKNYVGVCPVCANALRLITTDKGRFIGCVGYPDCSQTYPVPKTGALTILRSKKCQKGGIAVIDVGKKYNWAVGVGPCFNCDQKDECDPPETAGICPKCKDGQMVMVRLSDSRFLSCSKKCGHTQSLPKAGRLTILDEKCPICGWNLFRNKENEKEAEDFCANRRCRAIGLKNEQQKSNSN
ncbi:DNA topoisomerase [Methanolapillus millepedarum]|uniref:DNA topoisomerase n=1 Tax=Methanolapillus millepedarum TaxID=3028296 RepID=A0AA96VBU9_9EURY|nr:DNA topoisomerase 1 [Methanosarcinaceae archaeon Ac7]